MAADVILKITGQDNASSVFRKVSTEATRMGDEVDQAGTTGASGLEKINKASVALGAAIGSAVGFLSDASRASEESAAIQRQLEQAINNTGVSYSAYAEQVAAAQQAGIQLGIDDEQLAQAIQALTETTGDASVALQYLGLVQDLAAAKGMGLQQAATLVGKAYEGNYQALARYGIAVDKTASSQEVLATLQASVAGQAEAQSSRLKVWQVQLDNIVESIGGATGEFAPFIALLPGLSTGLSAAGAAGGALIDVLKNSATASKALTFALGPGGLLTAGAALAAIGVYQIATATSDYDEAVRRALGPTEDFSAALARLGESGSATELQLKSWGVEFQKVVDESKDQIEKFGVDIVPGIEKVWAALATIGTNVGPGAEQARADTQAWIDTLDDVGVNASQSLVNIVGIADSLDIYDYNAIAATESTINLNTAVAGLTPELAKQGDIIAALSSAMKDVRVGIDETVGGQKLLNDIQTIATKGTAAQRAELERVYAAFEKNPELYSQLAGTAHKFVSEIAAQETTLNKVTAARKRHTDSVIADMNAQALAAEEVNNAEQQRLATLAEWQRKADNESFYTKPADAFDYEADKVKVDAYYAAIEEGERKRREAAAARTVTIPDINVPDEVYIPGLADAMWELSTAGETAFDKIARGSTSAAVALSAFKEAQDGIISAQAPFNQQISEYNSQLNALQAAEDLLNQRREEGIQLTAEQQDFLNRVDAAQERLTGGTEDATLAAGELALQYAENMRIGDQMNESLGENASMTGELVNAINNLILSLDGVPDEVRTQVWVDTYGAEAAIGSIRSALDGLNGKTVTTYVDTVRREFSGMGFQDGGTVAYADGGTLPYDRFATGGTSSGRMALVGEIGPEMVYLPNGSQVTPSGATNSRLEKMGRGSGGITIHNLYLYPASPDVESAIRSQLTAGR